MLSNQQSQIRLLLLGMALGLCCCEGPGTEAYLHGSVNMIDRTVRELTQVGTLKTIRGFYGDDCQYRSSSGTWSLAIDGKPDFEDGSELVVRQGDAGCRPKISHVVVLSPSGEKTYMVEPNLALEQEYQDAASGCRFQTAPPEFFAVARLRSTRGPLFSSDFYIDMIYSQDPTRVDRVVRGQYATVQAAVQAENVPLTDYSVDSSGLSLFMDAQGTVTGKTDGQLRFDAVNQPGKAYVLTDRDPGTSASTIESAFTAGNKGLLSGPSLSVSAQELGLTEGAQLPLSRYLILANYILGAPAARSYQVFAFHFQPPQSN